MEDTLKTFHTICSFTRELQELFGKKYYNVTLYNRILEKTPITHHTAISKQIQIFKDFLEKNKEGILAKDVTKFKWDKIIFNSKIYINMKEIINDADDETKSSIWKYLLAISFATNQTDDLRDKIKEILSGTMESSSSSDNDNEKEYINNFMNKIQSKFEDKDFKDPMAAATELMQSGIFTDLVKDMDSDIKTGKINVNKLLGSVQGMLGNLSQETGGIQMPDMGSMFGMVNNMMNGQIPADGLSLSSLFGGLNMGQPTSEVKVEEIPSLEELLKPITHEKADNVD